MPGGSDTTILRRSNIGDHESSRDASGVGTSGMTAVCTSGASSSTWNDASSDRIAPTA